MFSGQWVNTSVRSDIFIWDIGENKSRLKIHFINPLNSGAAYIRVFIFYWHIKYYLLNMVKIKYDINQQDLKRVYLHFVKSE